MSVDLGFISESLLESALFGYKKPLSLTQKRQEKTLASG